MNIGASVSKEIQVSSFHTFGINTKNVWKKCHFTSMRWEWSPHGLNSTSLTCQSISALLSRIKLCLHSTSQLLPWRGALATSIFHTISLSPGGGVERGEGSELTVQFMSFRGVIQWRAYPKRKLKTFIPVQRTPWSSVHTRQSVSLITLMSLTSFDFWGYVFFL